MHILYLSLNPLDVGFPFFLPSMRRALFTPRIMTLVGRRRRRLVYIVQGQDKL